MTSARCSASRRYRQNHQRLKRRIPRARPGSTRALRTEARRSSGLFPVSGKEVIRNGADHHPVDADFGVVMPAAILENLAALLVGEVGSDRLHVLDAPYRGEVAVCFKQVLDGQRIQLGLLANAGVESAA